MPPCNRRTSRTKFPPPPFLTHCDLLSHASLGMSVPISQELLLAIHRCGTDFLELGGMAQRRKQRIGIESRIRAESILHCLTEQPQRNLISTAESFDFRCPLSNFRISKSKTRSAI